MKRAILAITLILLIPSLVSGFGKNKVQYRGFDWHILKSEHFDIYYYDGEEYLAERVALLAEASYDTLKGYFSQIPGIGPYSCRNRKQAKVSVRST